MNIKRKDISTIGLKELHNFEINTNKLKQLTNTLVEYKFRTDYLDDDYSWLTCVLALKVACKGNFGIGALLINSDGDITESGHNEVFYPYA